MFGLMKKRHKHTWVPVELPPPRELTGIERHWKEEAIREQLRQEKLDAEWRVTAMARLIELERMPEIAEHAELSQKLRPTYSWYANALTNQGMAMNCGMGGLQNLWQSLGAAAAGGN